jgi:hypothetical protein
VLPVGISGFSADAAAERTETAEGRTRVTFTRDSLIGGLADSGFYLRGQPGPLPEDQENDLLVTVRVPGGEIIAVQPATDPGVTPP